MKEHITMIYYIAKLINVKKYVIKRGSIDVREYEFKNDKDKEINVQVHESFSVVQLIMLISMTKREYFNILKNIKYKIEVSMYYDD